MSSARHSHHKFAKHGMLVAGGVCLSLILAACGGGSGGSATNSDGNDAPQITAAATNTATPAPVVLDSVTTCDVPNFQAEMMALVNAARAKGAVCGAVTRKPSKPLAWNDLLGIASDIHSHDMAANNFFDHNSPRTGSLRERIRGTGFQYEEAGENLAGGQTSVAKVVNDWLQSPSHCANMLNPEFKVMGASCKRNAASFYKNYWTLEMALPLGEKPETEIETENKDTAKDDSDTKQDKSSKVSTNE
jgi:uncharacterized protein YkwD